jgi:ABC-2 type transport system ATP-binding protein
MNMTTPVLKISNLSKTYPEQKNPAINNISLEINASEKVGIIGANGSGKTTFFRLILNLLHPDQGKIEILGELDQEKSKIHIGFVSEHQEGLENFTPSELLDITGKIYNMTKKKRDERIGELLQWTSLENNKDELIGGFSKGMFQRLQLALALFHKPKILILDEPMSGLDPEGQKILQKLLHRLEEYTLLYSSHRLTDIEELCERIIFFMEGKIANDIKLNEQQNNIFLMETEPAFLELLRDYSQIILRYSRQEEKIVHVEFIASNQILQDLITKSRKASIQIYRIKSKSILEDLYHKYTNHSI